MDENPASCKRWISRKEIYDQPKYKQPKTRSPKTTAKLIQNNVHCFFITIFRLAIPAFFRLTGHCRSLTENELTDFASFLVCSTKRSHSRVRCDWSKLFPECSNLFTPLSWEIASWSWGENEDLVRAQKKRYSKIYRLAVSRCQENLDSVISRRNCVERNWQKSTWYTCRIVVLLFKTYCLHSRYPHRINLFIVCSWVSSVWKRSKRKTLLGSELVRTSSRNVTCVQGTDHVRARHENVKRERKFSLTEDLFTLARLTWLARFPRSRFFQPGSQ